MIHGISPSVFGHMVLVYGIGSKLLNPGLDPLYWFSMVLSHGLNKGLPIKRKGDHLARHL